MGITNLVRMEARLPGPDGSGEVNIGMMIRAALRMRPDRIIVGEVRGTESADMMHALNTGHPGSMCTGHANSCIEMLERLAGMVMAGSSLPYEAIVTQLAMGIDLIVHITRNKEGKRFIDEISSVLPSKDNEFRLERLYVTDDLCRLQRVCDDQTLSKVAG